MSFSAAPGTMGAASASAEYFVGEEAVPSVSASSGASTESEDAIDTGEVLGNASFFQAVMNVLNILTGVGLLSIPFALRQAGWAGLGILWLLGIVTNYTGKALVECHDEVSRRAKAESTNGSPPPMIGYEDIGAAAFGALGRTIVSSVMYIELLGTCALLFILEGDNLFQLMGTRWAPSSGAYMVLAAAVMVPTVWLPDIKSLSYLGFAGITATFTVTAAVAYTLLTGGYTAGSATSMGNWATLPLVFGIMAFVYSGHGVFPSVRASMKRPQLFPKVLDAAYLVVGALCTFIGAAGYYMYGNAALDVVTFNLPKGLLATLCASLILVNPVAKFAITLDPVAVAANTSLATFTQGVPAGLRRFAVRTAMAGGCLAAARFVPFLAYVMSLIGSFLTISVSVIFPAACHLAIFRGKMSRRRLLWNYAVVAIGVMCALSGTAASLRALLQSTASA
ncbi:g5044 [Coccomyxa elongata]